MNNKRDGATGRRGDQGTIALRRGIEASPRRPVAPSVLVLLIAILILSSSCGSRSGVVPASATMGKCPVCHMTVKASDDWASEIYYKDGTKLMFESPTDMFAFYLAPQAFKADAAHSDPANIERIMVKDYQTKQAIDARRATLVVKSKVEGPMGPEILPFGKREDAEAFVAVNGGNLLAFNGILNDTIRDLRN